MKNKDLEEKLDSLEIRTGNLEKGFTHLFAMISEISEWINYHFYKGPEEKSNQPRLDN